jgi:hypothetical protein
MSNWTLERHREGRDQYTEMKSQLLSPWPVEYLNKKDQTSGTTTRVMGCYNPLKLKNHSLKSKSTPQGNLFSFPFDNC